MTDSLVTYLHDHLAGSTFAMNLAKSLHDQHGGASLGEMAAELLPELEADRAVLEDLIDRVGKRPPDLKQAAAWLSEKLSQLKLRRNAGEGLGTFEGLELLALGVLGKLALWRALAAIAETDARVTGMNLEELESRAVSQHARVEESRLQLARTALTGSSE